jgi:NSS family neurotransmitter:Na+ symporter
MAQRESWASRKGFLLAAVGSAVGLGNLWKFPYIAWDNGGGAFVLVYLVCIALVGLPIMVAEILIGRSTQLSPVGAFRRLAGGSGAWPLVGLLGVFTGFVILSYYSVIAGWSLSSFVRCLAWSTGEYTPVDFGAFVGNGPLQVFLAALFVALSTLIVFSGVKGGIERTTRILMPALFVLILVMVVRALTLPGAGQALSFLVRPTFSGLHPVGYLEALGHSFFTLSLGMGAMITYGSYMSKTDSVPQASIYVVVMDTMVALCACVIMYSILFTVPEVQERIGRSSVGMLFIILPDLFYEHLPLGRVLAPVFYVLVAFAALSSTISLLEVMVSYFIDERGWPRHRSALACALGTFALGTLCALSLGAWPAMSSWSFVAGKSGLLSHLDHLASNWLLPVGGLFITLFAGWKIDRAVAEREFLEGDTSGWLSFRVWRTLIRYVAPVAVAAIIAFVIRGVDLS